MTLTKYIRKGFKEFKREWRNDEWWQYRLPSLMIRGLYPLFNPGNDGIYVMKEDWDNLIILDACSYDLFKETNWIKGNLEKKISRGSHTWMFMKENFKDYYPDTVYISANPFIWDLKENFYQTIYVDALLPEIFLKYVLEADNYHKNKRLIIHFLQPHDPFIGETKIEEAEKLKKNPYYLFAKGTIKEETIWKAYQDNLKRVIPYVEELLKNLTGRTVITADHGEAFGAKIPFWPIRIYGHSGPRIKELIEVPWLIVEGNERKKITKGKNKEKHFIIDEKQVKSDYG